MEELVETCNSEHHHFGENNLQEVQKALKSMFSDTCKVLSGDNLQRLYKGLNKNAVVKALVADWLFSVTYQLDR